jgi:hypothetical protein
MRLPSALLLALLVSSPLAAQRLLPTGPEVRFDGLPFYAPDGRLLAGLTVLEGPGSRSADAVVRFYSPDGRTPLGPQIRVHAERRGSQTFSDLAFAADGSFAVLWTHRDSPGGTAQTRWRRFAPNGRPLGPEARAHGPIERDHFAGKIAAIPGGGWLLTWATLERRIDHPHEPLSIYSLVARRFRRDGSPLTSAFRMGGALDSHEIADLAVAPDGTAMAVYADFEGEDFYQVGGYRMGADGSLDFVELSPDDFVWEDSPNIEVQADGSFLAVWRDDVLGGIALRRFAPDGTPGEPVLLVPGERTVGSPRAALLPNGRLLVVWAQGTEEFRFDGVYGRVFTPRGAAVSPPFRLHLRSFHRPGSPDIEVIRRIAVRPDGSALVGWFGAAPLVRRLETRRPGF